MSHYESRPKFFGDFPIPQVVRTSVIAPNQLWRPIVKRRHAPGAPHYLDGRSEFNHQPVGSLGIRRAPSGGHLPLRHVVGAKRLARCSRTRSPPFPKKARLPAGLLDREPPAKSLHLRLLVRGFNVCEPAGPSPSPITFSVDGLLLSLLPNSHWALFGLRLLGR